MQDKKQLQQSGVSRAELGLASGGDGIALDFGGRLYVVGPKPFTIGRVTNADLFIDHPAVSRYHARIFRTKDGYVIEDLKSRNGVCVDAHRVKRVAAIFPGAVLTFGDVSVVVRNARRASAALENAKTDRDIDMFSPLDEDTGPIDGVLL